MSVKDLGKGSSGKRWEVRWRDSTGVQHKRRFALKPAALDFDASMRHAADPGGAYMTVEDLYPRWIAKKSHLKPTTVELYQREYLKHVQPEYGRRRLASLTQWEVAAWVGGKSPAVGRRCLNILRGIAKEAGVLLLVDPPRQNRRIPVLISQEQLEAVAAACGVHENVVWMLATTGMRFGEMAALRVGDVDVKRRRIRIARTVALVDGKPTQLSPKSGRSREVPVPAWLLDRIDVDRPAEAVLLPTRYNLPWRYSSWKRVWADALQQTGMAGLRVHDLRHAAARKAIEQGMDLRTLQKMLGHASLAMTTDLYGALAGDHLDEFESLWSAPKQAQNEGRKKAHEVQ